MEYRWCPTELIGNRLVRQAVAHRDNHFATRIARLKRESVAKVSKTLVLVVEDGPLIRWHAVEVVEQAGFEAVEASNADQAIDILQTRHDVKIVFTDIHMPGSMDGLTLAQAIRSRWPPIELILTSGRFNLREDELPDRGRFLPKPYNNNDIIGALREFA